MHNGKYQCHMAASKSHTKKANSSRKMLENFLEKRQENGPLEKEEEKSQDRNCKRTRQTNNKGVRKGGLRWQPWDSRHGEDIRHSRPPFGDRVKDWFSFFLCQHLRTLAKACLTFVCTTCTKTAAHIKDPASTFWRNKALRLVAWKT